MIKMRHPAIFSHCQLVRILLCSSCLGLCSGPDSSQHQEDSLSQDRWGRSLPSRLTQFPSAVFNMFLELEIPLARGERNPLFNMILDLFLINPMPIRGLKIDKVVPTREEAFARIEKSITGFGLDGEACVLRMLCEINAQPLKNGGLLGDIINLIFRGDISKEDMGDGRSRDYQEAKELGLRGDCKDLRRTCPMSVFNIPLFNT